MAENEAPTGALFNIDIPKPPANVAGAGKYEPITKAFNVYDESNDKLLEALENRYKQPNLFKVGAAFLKPQLGGFFASLGSAGEELGKWRENQLAMQATIPKMRAEMAAYRVPIQQQLQAQNIASTPGPVSPKGAGEIAALTGGIGTLPQAQQQTAAADIANKMSIQELRRIYADYVVKLGREGAAKAFAETFPSRKDLIDRFEKGESLAGEPPSVIGGVPKASVAGETPKETGEKPVSLLRGIPVQDLTRQKDAFPSQEQGNNWFDKQVEIRQAADLKNNESLSASYYNSRDVLKDIATAYELAADPAIGKALGIGKQRNPFDALITATENSVAGKLTGTAISDLARQFSIPADKLPKFQNLMNVLHSLEGKLAQTPGVGNFQNPSNLRTTLEVGVIPNQDYVQMSFLRSLEKMASEAIARGEYLDAYNKFLAKEGSDVLKFPASKEYNDVQKRNSERIAKTMSTYPKLAGEAGNQYYKRPSWMNIETGSAEEAPKTESAVERMMRRHNRANPKNP